MSNSSRIRPRILKESSEPFCVMHSYSNTSTSRNAHINPSDASVDTSITAFAMEMDYDAKGKEENLSSNNNDKSSSPDASRPSSSVEDPDQSRDQRRAGWSKQGNRSILYSLRTPQRPILVPKGLLMTLDGTRILGLTTLHCS
jgi:hypothetical protein